MTSATARGARGRSASDHPLFPLASASPEEEKESDEVAVEEDENVAEEDDAAAATGEDLCLRSAKKRHRDGR